MLNHVILLPICHHPPTMDMEAISQSSVAAMEAAIRTLTKSDL
jgi:hypothetical protein